MAYTRDQLIAQARSAAQRYGIDPNIFVRQIDQESGFNPNAVSPAGAKGVAQFMPGTAAGLGIDPMNPVQALEGAARYMAYLKGKYGTYNLALAAYNAGEGAVDRAGGVPAYAETQSYVSKILGAQSTAPTFQLANNITAPSAGYGTYGGYSSPGGTQMDSNNFVGKSGNGYVAYVGGQPVGTYASQAEAENAFNMASAGAGGGASAGAYPGYEYINIAQQQLTLNAAIAAAQQAYNQARLELIDVPMLELEKEKFAQQKAIQAAQQKLSEAGVTGYYNDNPTFQREQWQTGETGYINGTPTMAREAQEANIGLSAANLLSQMRGPSNAFQFANVASGLNSAGLGRYTDALAGRYSAPAYQAPQAQPQRMSFASLANDIRNTGGQMAYGTGGATGGAGYGGASGAQGQMAQQANQAAQAAYQQQYAGGGNAAYTAPTNLQARAAGDLSAISAVAPNKINRQYFKLPDYEQQMVLSGYEDLGYDPNYVYQTARKAALPQFRAPTLGRVA